VTRRFGKQTTTAKRKLLLLYKKHLFFPFFSFIPFYANEMFAPLAALPSNNGNDGGEFAKKNWRGLKLKFRFDVLEVT